MKISKIEQLPLTFHKAIITDKSKIKRQGKDNFVSIKNMMSDKIPTQQFHKPISKIFQFDEV